MLGGRDGKFFLTAEVMKKAALRETGSQADILNPGSGITLGANDVQSRVQEPGLRFMLFCI